MLSLEIAVSPWNTSARAGRFAGNRLPIRKSHQSPTDLIRRQLGPARRWMEQSGRNGATTRTVYDRAMPKRFVAEESRLPFALAMRGVVARGYQSEDARTDLTAGLTVGIVALPLSIALAIASGAPQASPDT